MLSARTESLALLCMVTGELLCSGQCGIACKYTTMKRKLGMKIFDHTSYMAILSTILLTVSHVYQYFFILSNHAYPAKVLKVLITPASFLLSVTPFSY
jgi:hypothetical protein